MRTTQDFAETRAERIAEAWRWVQAALDGQPLPGLLIVMGLGDGSLLECLEERAPATRVLAIEPNPAAARMFLTRRHLTAWRTSGRLVYLADPGYAGADEAWRIFKQNDEPKLVVHPTAFRAPGHARATEVLKKILSGVKANAQARRRFAPRYLANVLRNVPAIVAGDDVRSLTNAYQGVPAVVVAAGPSLDKAMPELGRAANGALTIVCDTALRSLLHAGVHPHLVVGADPSTANARHFQSLPPCPQTWLVAESALDPAAAATFQGRTFWFRLAPHHPWPWLNTRGLDAGLVEMWGSVLTAAFQVACLAGCDPIVITGADLSHTGGRPYARTTTYELDWAHAVARGETPEETWRGHVAGSRPIESTDLRGVATTTTPTMLSFRDWLVARAKRSGRRVINATGAGMLFGDGIEQGTLSAVIGQAREIRPMPAGAHRAAAVNTSEIAAELRIIRDTVVTNAFSGPVDDWVAFTEGQIDRTALAEALGEAAAGLESPRRTSMPVGVVPFTALLGSEPARPVFRQMPEAIARLRVGLSGGAPQFIEQDRGALLVRALDVLARLSEHLLRSDDLASGPDPAGIGRTPATALFPWPEAARWAVATFEALLGCAWHHAIGDVAGVETKAGENTRCGDGSDIGTRPHATQASLVLALEWTRCLASVNTEPDPSLIETLGRLASIEAHLRGRLAAESDAVGVILQIDAGSKAGAATFCLPLRLTDAALGHVTNGIIPTPAGTYSLAEISGPDLRAAITLSVHKTP